jgi:phosphoglycerate dehydrogenase-like enzyme
VSPLPLPSELLLFSPRHETDAAFEELRQRLEPVVGPVPVRLVHGDGSADPPPRPHAALITGGQPEALTVLASMGGEGWRWVHLTSSGPDHFQGWPSLPGDPLLTYSRGVNARSVAEWCLGAILHFYRDFGHYVQAAAEGRWERRWARELSGNTLVVMGAGAAGSELAWMASALGMRTVGVSLDGAPLAGFHHVYPPDEMERMLPAGDVTVILFPLSPRTRGSLGAPQIQALKEGSVLLVASRGGIVDEDAVAAAVQAGRLRGAAFDVFAQEPLPAHSPLWQVPGILVTPHVAGTTNRFMERTARILETIWAAVWGEGDPERLPYYRHRMEG